MTQDQSNKSKGFHREIGQLVETADGSFTVRHPDHGQDFHSREGARFEAEKLYVQASGFAHALNANRTLTPIYVLDVGMGLGYNACASIAAWLAAESPPALHITSLEINLALVESLANQNAPWMINWESSWTAGPKALNKEPGFEFAAQLSHPKTQSLADWKIVVQDASDVELSKDFIFDYIWQDPFTPELNPSLWSHAWFSRLSRHSHADTKLMTYSVSRSVKDALDAGGWHFERFPTPGKKRHWLRAWPKKKPAY